MLTATSGQQYPDLRSLCSGELDSGRMTQSQHDTLIGEFTQVMGLPVVNKGIQMFAASGGNPLSIGSLDTLNLLTSTTAFDWNTILSFFTNALPIVAAFVPGLQWLALAAPLIQQVIQLITSNAPLSSIWTAVQVLIAKVIPNLPFPLPGPTPSPNPAPTPGPAPTPAPGPAPVPNVNPVPTA